jgi:signal transduction histidine kinase
MIQKGHTNSTEEIDFRVIFESMSGNSILLKANPPVYNIITLTKGYLDYSPLTREELIGKGLFDIFPSNSEDENDTGELNLRASFARVMQYGQEDVMKNQRYDVLNKSLQFEERYWRASNKPVPDDQGQVCFIIHTVEEITESIKAKKVQAKVDEMTQMNNVFMQAPIAIHILKGPQLTIEMANHRTLEIWGKTKEIIGKPINEVLPELLKQGYRDAINKVVETGKPVYAFERPMIFQKKDLIEPRFYNFVVQPYYEANRNKAEGVLIFVNDATEKVRSQNALTANSVIAKESEDQLQFAIEATELGTFDYDPLTNKFSANDRLKEWFGLKPESEIALADAINAIAEKDRDRVAEAIKNALDIANGGSYEIEYLIKNPLTGREIYVRAKGRVWFNEARVAYRFNGTLQDVTQQVIAMQRVEELVTERTAELAEANKNLQRSNAELAQFAYIASHDLQEPLRKISTYSQMLENSLGDNLNEKSKSYFAKMHASASRMLTLIRDVLAYSQLSTTHNLLEKVDLNNVVENVKTDFELLIEQKHVTIKAEKLPVLEAIPLQMSQLFTNIISNALKFIRPDVDPVISISVVKMGRPEIKALPALDLNVPYYRITFEDNGIGFEQEYAEQIFNIFQRLHLKTAYEGTGIGLALCRKIVQNHHGDIYAESKKNKGATFNIILPEVQAVG